MILSVWLGDMSFRFSTPSVLNTTRPWFPHTLHHSIILNTEERVNNTSYWSETSLTNPFHRSSAWTLITRRCGVVDMLRNVRGVTTNVCFLETSRFSSSSMGTEQIGLIEENKHVMLSAAEASCRISCFINEAGNTGWKPHKMWLCMWSIQQCGHHCALKDLVPLEKKRSLKSRSRI